MGGDNRVATRECHAAVVDGFRRISKMLCGLWDPLWGEAASQTRVATLDKRQEHWPQRMGGLWCVGRR
jgi:hypothetical protein